MSRKIIGSMAAVSMALSGCANTIQYDDSPYFLFAAPLVDHEIWLQAKDGFYAACEDLNIHCDWIGPDVIDTQEMEQVMEIGILQHADAIITQGVVSKEIINKAEESNIPVFLVDSDVEDSKRTYYMGKDFKKQAELLLNHIEKNLGKDEKLIIAIQVAESDFKIAQDQIKEINEVFKKHKGGFEIVSVSDSKSEEVRARKEWEVVIHEHPDINVAINFAAESAEFCVEAIENQNILHDILIYGVDDMPITLNLIKEGKIEGTVVTSFYDYGYQGVKFLYDYITRGDKSLNQKSPKLQIIDQNNIKVYEEKNNEK